MGLQQRELARRLEVECASLRFEYVSTELDVAITFCEVAASLTDVPAKNRALARAANAYECAERYKDAVEFTQAMRAEIERRELRLNSLLVVARSPVSSG
ncbi:MAG TPA: hypothetical protein VFU57_10415 [Candidatus Acidoferrales bacterium]|nr:hypothetical protein [Candidatus Acidoferrales bacterium]